MSLYVVEVGVALKRPPRTEQYRKYVIEAENGYAAELIAQQWASCAPGVVMPTESVVTDWEDSHDTHAARDASRDRENTASRRDVRVTRDAHDA